MVHRCRGCKEVWIPTGELMCEKCFGKPSSGCVTAPSELEFTKVALEVMDKHYNTLEKLAKHDTGGKKYDQEKPAMGLIPARALEEEGYVWGFGEKKYGQHNWRQGLSILRICGAIMRHTAAIMRGEDIDESGRHHAAHIRCEAAMLIEFFYEGRTDLDDRHKKQN